MRKLVFGSGWKMFLTDKEAIAYAELLKQNIDSDNEVELFVLPSFTALDRVNNILSGTDIKVGAQNMCWEDKGAFTGEVSVLSLTEMGIKYIEIGHSERRALFGETNETINLKIRKSLEHNLIPVFCIGENSTEKNLSLAKEILAIEIKTALNGVSYEDSQKIIFAYEPVWAIGKAEAAQPCYVECIHKFIREILMSLYAQSQDGTEFRIIYGGSVSPDNAEQLLNQPNIDGVFVGRASLNIESYFKMLSIVKSFAVS